MFLAKANIYSAFAPNCLWKVDMCGNSQRRASESVGLRWLQSILFSFFRSLSGLLPNLDSSGDPAKFNQSFPRTCPGVHASALSVAKELVLCWSFDLFLHATGAALHLLEVCRRRGGRWLQGKASPSRRQWNECCCTVCACCPHVLHWKRTEGHTRGGGKKCAIPQEREGQENKGDVALVFESEKRRSVPQPSSFLLREMQARGRFQSVISGLWVSELNFLPGIFAVGSCEFVTIFWKLHSQGSFSVYTQVPITYPNIVFIWVVLCACPWMMYLMLQYTAQNMSEQWKYLLSSTCHPTTFISTRQLWRN